MLILIYVITIVVVLGYLSIDGCNFLAVVIFLINFLKVEKCSFEKKNKKKLKD